MGNFIELIPLTNEFLYITYWWRNNNRQYFLHNDLIAPEQHQEFINGFNGDGKWCYVILYNNVPVGTIGIKDNDGAGDINWVLLANNDIKGHGVMDKALDLLLAKHSYMVYTLQVRSDNPRAIGFYQRNGFKITKCENDIYYMEKRNELNSAT